MSHVLLERLRAEGALAGLHALLQEAPRLLGVRRRFGQEHVGVGGVGRDRERAARQV